MEEEIKEIVRWAMLQANTAAYFDDSSIEKGVAEKATKGIIEVVERSQ